MSRNPTFPGSSAGSTAAYPDRLWVTIDGDRLRHAETGELLSAESDGDMNGWGNLDGPMAALRLAMAPGLQP